MNINDIVHGFKITNIRHIDEINCDIYDMVHLKTTAKTYWLKRNDENKTFCIGFKTTPVDDTGVFHILEHSVLNGSKRYPVREPFVDLLKGSLQTFLNAITYPDKTVYPVSSRNNTDFINLMRVYLDAVFNPLAKTNKNIFLQEGWHYEIHSPEEQPVYNGVVFNEMKGAFSSSDSVRSRYMMHSLFPDTSYGNESGGDPEVIPTLTYEQFCATHDKYYSPQNAVIILDGDMDIEAILQIIDEEYLSNYCSEGEKITIDLQQPIISETVYKDYEVAPGTPLEGKGQIGYGYVVGNFDDYVKNSAFSLIASVLCGSNESPLKKAIIDNGLGEDVFFYIEDGVLQPYVQIDVNNTDVNKEAEISKAINDCLETVVAEGLDKEELEAALNQKEYYAKELDFGGAPKGLVFSLTSISSAIYDKDPVDSLTNEALFQELREKINTTYYEDLLKEYILNSDHKAEVVLRPSETLGIEKLEKEQARLAAIKESWSEKELADMIQMNEDLVIWQQTPDTPEQQATLPQLHIEDLKKTPTELPKDVCLHKGSNVVLKHNVDTNGISYVTLYSNIQDFTLEQYSTLGVLTTLLGCISTEKYNTLELNKKMKNTLGNFGVSISTCVNRKTTENSYYFTVSWSTLARNDLEGVELIREILYHTIFTEKDAIRNIIKQNRTTLENSFISAGHSLGTTRAAAYSSIASATSEYASGYEAYKFLKDLDENWEEKGDEFINELEEITKTLFIKERLMISVNSLDNPRIVKAIIDTAPEGILPQPSEKKPLGHNREGIIIPADVSYACKVADVKDVIKNPGTLFVLSNILTYDYLWNKIRVQGGAYGTGFTCRTGIYASFYSYRDPNPANSLSVYEHTCEYLDSFLADDQDIEKYIVGASGDYDSLLSPKQQIKSSDVEYLTGLTMDMKQEMLDQILATTKQDILEAKAVFEKINEIDDVCVIGNKEAVNNCADKLDNIFNL